MKYLSTFWIFLVLAGTAAEPVFAADSPQQNLMQAAIDLGHRYDTTYGTKNPAAMAEIYAEDGVLISPAGPIVRGRDALAAYYAKRFASGAHDHSIANVFPRISETGTTDDILILLGKGALT